MSKWAKIMKEGNLADVKEFLGNKSPNQMCSKSGESLLAKAAELGRFHVVSILLSLGADPNDSATTLWPLSAAAGNGDVQTLEALLFAEADLEVQDEDGCTPLFSAVAAGHCEVVSLLLEAGANPKHKNKAGESPIICAANCGQSQVVEALAPYASDVEIKQLELRKKTISNEIPSTEVLDFIEAATRGDTTIASKYLESGGDVNAIDESGMTALSWAVCRGNDQIIDFLLSHGADPNHVDLNGASPLILARTEPIIEKLLPITKEYLVEDWKKSIRRGYNTAKESPHVTDEMLDAYRSHYRKYVGNL